MSYFKTQRTALAFSESISVTVNVCSWARTRAPTTARLLLTQWFPHNPPEADISPHTRGWPRNCSTWEGLIAKGKNSAHPYGGLPAFISLITTASGDHLWLKMASQEETLLLSMGRSVIFNWNPFHLDAWGKQACSAESVLWSQHVLSQRNVTFGKQTGITYLPRLIHVQHGCQGKTGWRKDDTFIISNHACLKCKWKEWTPLTLDSPVYHWNNWSPGCDRVTFPIAWVCLCPKQRVKERAVTPNISALELLG